MEQYKLVLAQKAATDIRDAVRYVAVNLHEPSTAEELYQRFRGAIDSLKTMPERFGLVADEELAACGVRMMSVGNYLIFYIVSRCEHRVNILRVLYGRRNWIHLLKTEVPS